MALEKIKDTPTATEVIQKTNEVVEAVNGMQDEKNNLVAFDLREGHLIMQTASLNVVSGQVSDDGRLVIQLGNGG